MKPVTVWSSTSSTPRCKFGESVCFASTPQFIISVLLKASLCIVMWCFLTMRAWFVVWSAVNRKGWRSLLLCVWRCWTARAALEGKCAYCAFSGLIKCVTVFSQQRWAVARAVGSWLCSIFVCLFFLVCRTYFVFQSANVGIMFTSVWSDMRLFLCERQQCSVDAWSRSAKCSKPFACGHQGCIFSRHGQQVSQLTVAMQQ